MKKRTTLEFITLASDKHKYKFDYSITDYKNARTEIDFICPIHGKVSALPSVHLRGHDCKECADEHRNDHKLQLITKKELVQQSNKKFNKNFKFINLPKGQFSINEKVEILCSKHGKFMRTPKSHLKSDFGCVNCSSQNRGQQLKLTKTDFINKSNIAQNFKCDYSDIIWDDSPLIDIVCLKHGIFTQLKVTHIQGFQGCKLCSNKNDIDKSYNGEKTTLYLVKIDNMYKIGLTKTTVHQRYKYDKKIKGMEFSIIKTWDFEDGLDAYYIEQMTLEETLEFNTNKKILEAGNTELRTVNILNYIIKNVKLLEKG